MNGNERNPEIVIITTTIHDGHVLRSYAQCSPRDVEIIIAGDWATSRSDMDKLCNENSNITYLSVDKQESLGLECSRVIGWNTIQRRNIALYEAIRRKPEIIVTIDDDNIPVYPYYYTNAFRDFILREFSGVMVTIPQKQLSPSGVYSYFNVGDMFDKKFNHRGLPPYSSYGVDRNYVVTSVVNGTVGVQAGLWHGDPDINAVERIVNKPIINNIPSVLHEGVFVDNMLVAPFNSQNTAFRTELAPMMAVLPGIGRYDDIWASYIAQRIMKEIDMHVLYGPPFVYQERNAHNVLQNLKDEMFGMSYTDHFVYMLSLADIKGDTIMEMLENLWNDIQDWSVPTQQMKEFGEAWIKDMKRIV